MFATIVLVIVAAFTVAFFVRKFNLDTFDCLVIACAGISVTAVIYSCIYAVKHLF